MTEPLGDILHDQSRKIDTGGGDYFENVILPTAPIQALHQIPPPPRDFKGREQEMHNLLGQIGSGVMISGLQGFGGIGKTALARALAHSLKDKYPDADFSLDLRGAGDNPVTPAEALRHVIREFVPRDAPLPDEVETLRNLYLSVLHDKRAILLWDNAKDSQQVQHLIPPDGCLMLVTSRNYIKLPGLETFELGKLREDEAIDLLQEIAPRISDDHAQAIAELCDYLPMALRAAGSVLAEKFNLDPADYIMQLQDVKQRLQLADPERGDLTVAASIELSLTFLDDELQRLWRMLAVFQSHFDHLAAAAVWWEDIKAADKAKEPLAQLVNYSLLEYDTLTERYDWHDLARVYARTQCQGDEKYTVHLRHARHYIQVLWTANQSYKKGGEDISAGLQLFDSEWEQIQDGQLWAAKHADDDKVVAELAMYYPLSGIYPLPLRLIPHELFKWLRLSLMLTRRLNQRELEASALLNLGNICHKLGQYGKSIIYYKKMLDILVDYPYAEGESNARGGLGNVYLELREVECAIDWLNQALTICREVGYKRGIANWLGNLGIAHHKLEQYDQAIEYYEQALVVRRETGDKDGEANDLGNMGETYRELGQFDKAIEIFQEALIIDREVTGNRRGEAETLHNLGIVYAQLKQFEESLSHFRQAEAIFASLYLFHRVDLTRQNITRTESLQRGETLPEDHPIDVLLARGSQLMQAKMFDEAKTVFEQALAQATDDDDKGRRAHALGGLGMVYVSLNDADNALKHLREARDTFAALGNADRAADCDAIIKEIEDTLGDG